MVSVFMKEIYKKFIFGLGKKFCNLFLFNITLLLLTEKSYIHKHTVREEVSQVWNEHKKKKIYKAESGTGPGTGEKEIKYE